MDEEKIELGIKFFKCFQKYLHEKHMFNTFSYATSGSISRVIYLFIPDDIDDEEGLKADLDVVKRISTSNGFEKWIKEQLELLVENGRDEELERRLFIGNSEDCEYKTSEEFINDLDYQTASGVIKYAYEKAKNKYSVYET